MDISGRDTQATIYCSRTNTKAWKKAKNIFKYELEEIAGCLLNHSYKTKSNILKFCYVVRISTL